MARPSAPPPLPLNGPAIKKRSVLNVFKASEIAGSGSYPYEFRSLANLVNQKIV